MLSRGDDAIPASDDVALKIMTVTNRWSALYAGSPTSATLIVEEARRLMPSASDRQPDSLERIRAVTTAAYKAVLRRQATDQFLGIYDLTLEQFRRAGRRQFGESEFAQINKQIRDYTLRTQLLVCGVDNDQWPHIFTINHPGIATLNDLIGHAAIGSGAQMALGSLGGRILSGLPIRDLIYRVCEAKFSAETAHGVGKSTLLTVLRKGFEHTAWGVQTDEIKQVSESVRKESALDKAIELVDAAFGSTGVFIDLRRFPA